MGDLEFDLAGKGRVFVVGAGKAGAPMAAAVEEVAGDAIAAGTVVVKHGHAEVLERVRIHEAGHPVPDEHGVEGARAILDILRKTGPDDLVLCLLSGGGSALLVSPVEGVSLQDLQRTTEVLLASGADIVEINAVRKHLSRVKGGGLARAAGPAAVATLILSDVVGDRLDSIASGPTVADTTTYGDCLDVIRRRGIEAQLPAAVLRHLEAGAAGEVAETPKPGDASLGRVTNLIVANNDAAVTAAGEAAAGAGYTPLVLSTTLQGEAREVARALVEIAREARRSGRPTAAPACLLAGGETTVTLAGEGKGGRNQEMALAACLALDGEDGIVFCSVGTDGTDGPTDAAGAVADGTSAGRARQRGMDPRDHLRRNDSHHLFEALGDLWITGPTRTNVMDLQLLLVR